MSGARGFSSKKKMYDMFSGAVGNHHGNAHYGVQSGEISRVSQYVSKIILAFDNTEDITTIGHP